MLQPRDLANAIRALSMDAVQAANSGHPGMPMGMADIAQVLWHDFLSHDPKHPDWLNRDRFVVSNGHGSMLLYSLLHLAGYDLSLDELKNFRQLGSKTPGHPEYGHTPGVETTTGPLGNGIANAVGMAIAEKKLAGEFNRDGFEVVDHYTYVFMGDGCLMEGISHEACSLAGTLGLNKLIAFWDDNGISIDGEVEPWFSDDTPKRFEAYGWHVIRAIDGHDAKAVKAAIEKARAETHKPTLICTKTTIGFGSPNVAGKAKAHGAPLGEAEIAASRKALNWPYAPFEIPQNIYDAWNAEKAGAERFEQWNSLFKAYAAAHPALASEFMRRMKGELPQNFNAFAAQWLKDIQAKQKDVATRKASHACITDLVKQLPELVGGSADLSVSNLTIWDDAALITRDAPAGDYIEYGVREFGMCAIMNGLALHGGVIPFGGTFLVFSDYARPALRLAALMKQRVLFVFTHDSIGVGEDGPTHQPIEHLASLRLIPHLHVWRPCDTFETAVAWQQALQHQGPSLFALSRQNTVAQARDEKTQANVAKGGYILSDCDGKPDLIIMATGSEVELAVDAARHLSQQGKRVRVVSMPCMEVFLAQPAAYQEAVLPQDVTARVAVEAGRPETWLRFVRDLNQVVGLSDFGASAPGATVYEEMGLTQAHVLQVCEQEVKNGN